jgi:hypothetical protein
MNRAPAEITLFTGPGTVQLDPIATRLHHFLTETAAVLATLHARMGA